MNKIKLILINYDEHEVYYFDTQNLDESIISNILNLNRNNIDTTNFLGDTGLEVDIHKLPNPYQTPFVPKYQNRLTKSDNEIDQKVNSEGGCPSIIIYI